MPGFQDLKNCNFHVKFLTKLRRMEAAELAEAEASDTEMQNGINQNCDNCASCTSIEKRLTLKLRAIEKTKQCLQKQNKNQKNELDDCRRLLALKVKENIEYKGKLQTNDAIQTINIPEIITVPEEEAEALKTCEYCAFKTKGEVLMQRHQKSVHFRCQACNMVAISMKHLLVHKKSVHPKTNCAPCGKSFKDEIRCEVHILKEHPYQCEECGDKYTQKANLDIHIKSKHPKEMKCILCDFKAKNVTEITEHYEEVHLGNKDPDIEEIEKDSSKELAPCKNGPTCRFLREKKMQFCA